MSALESQKAQIEAMIESAKRQLASRPAPSETGDDAAEGKSAAPATKTRRKGRRKTMSPEARARISEAQRKRWATSKKTGDAPAKKAVAKTKRGGKRTMSPEARKRIAEAQRLRWANSKKAVKQ